jgi:transcriptional regulator with XRE-family HTH domain
VESQPPDPCAAFGQRLRRIRLARGLSQEHLAHIAGLDRTYVSSCEAGRRNVTIRTIVRLSAALEVDPCALVSDAAPASAEGCPQV